MIVDFDILRNVSLVLKRHHKAKSFLAPARISVNVAEASSKDCPLVATIRDAGLEETIEVRTHGGGLYRRKMYTVKGVDDSIAADAEWLRATAADPIRAVNLVDAYRQHDKSLTVLAADDPSVARVLADSLDAYAAAIGKWSAKSIVIDGFLWKRTVEPKLVTNQRGGKLSAVFMSPSSDYQRHQFDMFRLDHLDLAQKWLLKTTGTWHECADEITVQSPEFLSFRADEWNVLRAAARMIETLLQAADSADEWTVLRTAPLHRVPMEELLALKNDLFTLGKTLQDAEDEVDAAPSDAEPHTEAVVRAVENLVAGMERRHREAHPHDRFRPDAAISGCQLAITRWRTNRLAALEDDLSAFGSAP